jgi:hypothetical protein
MRRLLRPLTPDEISAILRARIGAQSSGEQFTLADAGLEDEVSKILTYRDGTQRWIETWKNSSRPTFSPQLAAKKLCAFLR